MKDWIDRVGKPYSSSDAENNPFAGASTTAEKKKAVRTDSS